MSVFIGSTTTEQRACLSKEFKKLYAKKTFIPRKQKIAIALNTCDVGIKGVPLSKDLGKQIELLNWLEEVKLDCLVNKKAQKYGTEATSKLYRNQLRIKQNRLSSDMEQSLNRNNMWNKVK